MLMSLSQRYVFLANGKAASSSFEAAYGKCCEIAASNNNSAGLHPKSGGGGKHVNYRAFATNFEPFFRKFLPIQHFFVFGIIREPMQKLHSQYRYWSRPRTKAVNRLPGISDFAEFVDHVVNRKPIGGRLRVNMQYDVFMDQNHQISLNYLIKLEDMKRSVETLREISGLDFSAAVVTVRNANSPSANQVDPGLRRVVEEFFARDYELYERKTDRLLREWDRGGELDVDAALRWMTRDANRFEIAATLLYKLRLRLETEPGFDIAALLASIDGDEATRTTEPLED